MIRIIKVLGENDFYAYVKKYNLIIPKEVRKLLKGAYYEQQPWKNFITSKNKHLCHPDAIDLLDKMLQYDKNLRIRPKDAMKHSYFDPIREFIAMQKANNLE